MNDSLIIDTARENKIPYPNYLYQLVTIGDSLIIKAYSDTIYLKRNKDTLYRFNKFGLTANQK